MQRFLFSLTVLLSLYSFSSSAQDVTVAAVVTTAFQSSFKQATDVQWKDGGHYYKADFTLNGQTVSAFYNQQGNLIGVTKNLSPVQLPVTLQASLKSAYEAYWISELFEMSNEQGTRYYATVENSETKIVLKASNGTWTTYKKSRKS